MISYCILIHIFRPIDKCSYHLSSKQTSLSQTESIIENRNWTQCRNQPGCGAQTQWLYIILTVLHLWLRGCHGRGDRETVEAEYQEGCSEAASCRNGCRNKICSNKTAHNSKNNKTMCNSDMHQDTEWLIHEHASVEGGDFQWIPPHTHRTAGNKTMIAEKRISLSWG